MQPLFEALQSGVRGRPKFPVWCRACRLSDWPRPRSRRHPRSQPRHAVVHVADCQPVCHVCRSQIYMAPAPRVTRILPSDAHQAILLPWPSLPPSIHGGNPSALGECTPHTFHTTLTQAPINFFCNLDRPDCCCYGVWLATRWRCSDDG